MRSLLILFILLTRLPADSLYVQDTINTDQTWSDTIVLTGNTVIQGAVVTVDPGTEIIGNMFDLKIKDDGVLYAAGTAGARIHFYRLKLIYEALTRDSLNLLRHCLLENWYCLLEFRNPSGVTEKSELTVQDCEFYDGGYTLLYITSGASVTITRCGFHDASSGIFVHGGEDVDISFTSIYNVGCGIIHATMADWFENVHCDHVTIYDVDDTRGYDWSKGQGIVCLNEPPGSLQVSNSIFSNIAEYAIKDYNYDQSNAEFSYAVDYNCYYMLGFGVSNYIDVGAHGLETDPLLVRPDSGDFSLDTLSPCYQSAGDGLNRGMYQPPGVNPVVLSAFTARALQNGILLTWRTHSEQDNLGWYVLKSGSPEGPFSRVHGNLLPGSGTTALPQIYSYTDPGAGDAAAWYRLEQVDLDGRRTLSAVIAFTPETTGIFTHRPAGQPGRLPAVPVYSVTGRPVMIWPERRTDRMDPGVYFVRQKAGPVKILVLP